MPTSDGRLYSFKYVNGHPKNTASGLLTVTAFGVPNLPTVTRSVAEHAPQTEIILTPDNDVYGRQAGERACAFISGRRPRRRG